MNSIVVAVDCSTTACKAIAWDRSGRLIAASRRHIPVHTGGPGEVEQDANSWWESVCGSTRELSEHIDVREIAALCITHQRESFVPVDRDGAPIHPALLWLDDRSHAEVDELTRTFGAKNLHALTGKPPSTTPSLPKLMWLRKHKPEVINRTWKILDTHAFLVHRLTGEYRTSLPSADPMGIVDMVSGTWASDLIRDIGLYEDLFPEIHPAGSIIGHVGSSAAGETGLPEGLPVAAGAGDGQCAGLGAGIAGPGPAYLNLGTGVVSGVFTREYQTSSAFRTLCAPLPGTFCMETVLKSGTRTIDWFLETFESGHKDRGVVLEDLEKEASGIRAGSDGLLVVPYWGGAMNPYWDPLASGITIGWRNSTTRQHVYRAILEGMAFEQRLATEEVATATGTPITEYRVMGGGSQSELWCQIFADVAGIPTVRCSTTESTCLGAAILASLAAGWYSDIPTALRHMTGLAATFNPQPAVAETYGKIYEEVYTELYPRLRDLSARLRGVSR